MGAYGMELLHRDRTQRTVLSQSEVPRRLLGYRGALDRDDHGRMQRHSLVYFSQS